MERKPVESIRLANNDEKSDKVYTPYPGADEKYDDGRDWRLYNPDKYRDPNWSPEKE